MKSTLGIPALIISLVAGHGMLTSPPPRQAGASLKAICGVQVYNNQKSDPYGNIQQIQQIAKSQKDVTPGCNMLLCKGFTFEDNKANVQTFSAGQQVPMKFDIRAPHTGTANVSIVDTATNTLIGAPLKTYTDFASNSKPITNDQKTFTITMPDLAGKCTQPGECVVQHFWDSPSAKQTYESCVDFTMGGAPVRRQRNVRRQRGHPRRI